MIQFVVMHFHVTLYFNLPDWNTITDGWWICGLFLATVCVCENTSESNCNNGEFDCKYYDMKFVRSFNDLISGKDL